ncbi:hypothetical protein LINGRAHAP2_LOCUS27635 [Linum grandiflorum]
MISAVSRLNRLPVQQITSMENNGNAVVPPNPQRQQPNPQGEPDPLPVNLPQQHAVIGGDAPTAAAADDAVNAAGDDDEPAALAFGAKCPFKRSSHNPVVEIRPS